MDDLEVLIYDYRSAYRDYRSTRAHLNDARRALRLNIQLLLRDRTDLTREERKLLRRLCVRLREDEDPIDLSRLERMAEKKDLVA